MNHMHTPGGADIGHYFGNADGRSNILSDSCPDVGRHVMLVQHNGIELCVLKEMLSALGCCVTTASEVGKAILYFVRDRHDLIISELDLPGLSGFQLAQRMKIHAPDTRIVLLTARCQAEVAAYMNTRVVDGWLFKPFRLQTLGEMLRKLAFSDTYTRC
jgi:two-component system capsular synthesis sensor histidine kinase RcsC